MANDYAFALFGGAEAKIVQQQLSKLQVEWVIDPMAGSGLPPDLFNVSLRDRDGPNFGVAKPTCRLSRGTAGFWRGKVCRSSAVMQSQVEQEQSGADLLTLLTSTYFDIL